VKVKIDANSCQGHGRRAGEVVIDRTVNRHAAFGLGIHRCLRSHLARMELRAAHENADFTPEAGMQGPLSLAVAVGISWTFSLGRADGAAPRLMAGVGGRGRPGCTRS
jgi:hypothetical protein